MSWLRNPIQNVRPSCLDRPPTQILWAEVANKECRKPSRASWCVVANISDHITRGPDDEVTSGTKHFAAGTRVYCYPPLWGDGYEDIKVIARHRGSKRYVEMIIAGKSLINCRAKLVYSPYLLDHLSGSWDETPESKEKAEGLASLLNKRNASRLNRP